MLYLLKGKSKPLLTSYFVFCLSLNSSIAQENLFKDTNPTNNIDSIKLWLHNNIKPTPQRLKNLIILQKTYIWQSYPNNVIEEIGQLSIKLNNKSGQIFYYYIKALLFNNALKVEEGQKYFAKAQLLLSEFDDFHTQYYVALYQSLVFFNSRSLEDNSISNKYIDYAEKLLKTSNNPHDKIALLMMKTMLVIRQSHINQDKLATLLNDMELLTKKFPELHYAKVWIDLYKMEYLIITNKYLQAVALGEDLIKEIDKKNPYLLSYVYNLMGTGYEKLKENELALKSFTNSLNYYYQIPKDFESHHANITRYERILNIFNNFRNFAKNTQDYKLATALSDSIIYYKTLDAKDTKDKSLIEMRAKYNYEKSELEIKNLSTKKQRLLFFLIITIFLISLLLLLLFKIRRTNRKIMELNLFRDQFYTIFTHDIRGSIDSLLKASTVLNYLIIKNEPQEITKITNQIGWLSCHASQLVNNVLDWGVNNGYNIDTTPSIVNITEEIQGIIEEIKPALKKKNNTISFEKGAQETFINTSQKCFEVVFRNALTNAKKHSKEASSIKVIVESSDENMAEVIVENNYKTIDNLKVDLINKIFNNQLDTVVGQYGIGLGVILMKTYANKNNTMLKMELMPEEKIRVVMKFYKRNTELK
ncbi:ATP-binding protein [Emticicia sp. 17c]|uniref:ATP-binding protein n=1 Tax=Emticicia sp. 17c TaxID=3127704 RepID=UPI00301CD10E